MSQNDLTSYQVLSEYIRQLLANGIHARDEAEEKPAESRSTYELIRELAPASIPKQAIQPPATERTAVPSSSERSFLATNLGGLLGLADRGRKTSPLDFLSPIVSAITSLFSSERPPEPEPVYMKYFPFAKSGREQRGVDGSPYSEAMSVDYSEHGLPRPIENASRTNVVVNVQAIDSRSFLDHSDDIAAAMRRALFESGGVSGGEADI